MTYFVADENGYIADFASIGGLARFREAVGDDGKALGALLNSGVATNLKALAVDLEKLRLDDPIAEEMRVQLVAHVAHANGMLMLDDGSGG
jgi:hypothetical protein